MRRLCLLVLSLLACGGCSSVIHDASANQLPVAIVRGRGSLTPTETRAHIRRSQLGYQVSPFVRNEDYIHRPFGRRLLNYDKRSIRRWLSAHNEERKRLYSDAPLSWDASLARFAQRHADSIGQNLNCSPEFNEDNEQYGENVFWGVYEHGREAWTLEEAVENWRKQKELYNRARNHCVGDKDENCAAYLQVVWRNTTRIGCGEVFCPYHGDFKGVAQFFVCNYSPAADLGAGHRRPF